jgi:uncharacterized protein
MVYRMAEHMPERAPPLTSLAGTSLSDIAEAIAGTRLPPVETWNPPHCGESGIRIAADGTWLHDGDPFRRPEMVRLFASILRREGDGTYVLVTPVEKLSITVDDLPFVAVELASEGAGRDRSLGFRLNTDTPVVAGPDHPLLMQDGRPLLRVRNGIDARIARPVFYELAEIALAEGSVPPGLWSNGAFFALDQA